MKGRTITSAMLCLIVSAIMTNQMVHAESIFDPMGGNNLSLLAEDTRLILGRVTKAVLPPREAGRQVQFPAPVTYQAVIMCEYRARIPENTAVRIDGRMGVQGSAPVNIPLLKENELFLMAIRVTPDRDRFEYAGAVWLPIGVQAPVTLDPKSAQDLNAALIALGEIASKPDNGALSREEALALTSETNYYLWALGITSLARWGFEKDVRMLLSRYDDEKVSLREVLWLEHCFEYVVPTAARPSVQQRHQALLHYLQRAAANPMTKPAR